MRTSVRSTSCAGLLGRCPVSAGLVAEGIERGPVRAAKDEAVEIVSVSATSAIPSAPAISNGRSDTDSMLGTVSGGNPLGRVPTIETPWEACSAYATHMPGVFALGVLERRLSILADD